MTATPSTTTLAPEIDPERPPKVRTKDSASKSIFDPAIVKRQVEAAGFKFEGESKALANPTDDHTKAVFDPSIRGHTDQFIYKFRKPK